MKKRNNRFVLPNLPNLPDLLIAMIMVAMLGLGAGAQSVPSLINYQGKLTDPSGAAVAPGTYAIQFRIWDSPTAANSSDLIWAQQQNLTVQSNGVFNVILGSPGGSTVPGAVPAVNNLAFAFGGSNCFLGVTVVSQNGSPVSSPAEILPRQQLMSVPFAVQAQTAQVAVQAQVASGLVASLAASLSPPGSIIAFGGGTTPGGWILCDGSAVSRTNYAQLFAAIGAAWGNGDGSTTFNVPDLRGMFLRGVNGGRNNGFTDPDSAARTSANTGGNTGNAVGSVQLDIFGSHTHTYRGGGSQVNPGNPSAAGSGVQYTTADVPVTSTGGNETRPKNAYVNYIIKY